MYCEGGRSRTGKLAEKRQAAASAAWRSRPARRSCRSRSTARRRCATGSGCSSRRSPCSTASRSAGSASSDPTRDQQQAVADEIFDEIKALYAGLEAHGRKGVARRVREQRRAERAGRKKAAPASAAHGLAVAGDDVVRVGEDGVAARAAEIRSTRRRPR